MYCPEKAYKQSPLPVLTDALLKQVPAISDASKAILLNKGALAINADPLGRMPFRYAINASGIDGLQVSRHTSFASGLSEVRCE